MKEKVNKYCQSCGAPLEFKDKKYHGTEADGTPSAKYCNYCYKDGAFINPDITFEEMHKYGKEGIRNSKDIKGFKKKMILMFYTKGYLKKHERWKNQK